MSYRGHEYFAEFDGNQSVDNGKLGRKLAKGGGGGGGGPTTSYNTTTSTNLPDYAKPYYQELLKQTGKSVFDTDAKGNVTGVKAYNLPEQTMAGFNPQQEAVQREIANYQTSGNFGKVSDIGTRYGEQGMAAAMGNTQDYMSPYIQGALNPQIQELERQNAINRRNAALKSAASGTYGGARGAFMQAQLERDAQQNIANTLGKGYQSAYEAAMARQKDLGALGLQGLELGIAGGAAQQKADFERLQAQSSVGSQIQAQKQAELDTAYQNAMAKANFEKQQLQYYSDMLRGNAGALGSSQVTYAPRQSDVASMAGLGIAGLGLAGAMSKGT